MMIYRGMTTRKRGPVFLTTSSSGLTIEPIRMYTQKITFTDTKGDFCLTCIWFFFLFFITIDIFFFELMTRFVMTSERKIWTRFLK